MEKDASKGPKIVLIPGLDHSLVMLPTGDFFWKHTDGWIQPPRRRRPKEEAGREVDKKTGQSRLWDDMA